MDIIIRKACVTDAADYAELYSQPIAQSQTLQLPYPGPEQWQEKLNNIPAGMYRYVAQLNGKVVGDIGLQHMQSPRVRHCASFGLAVHDAYQKRGIGQKLIAAILDLADNWLNIRRIQIEVFADNQAAIALYKKMGFNIEGEAIDSAFRQGQYVNTLYMARINNKNA